MSRSIVIPALLFVVGIIVGRLSVVAPQAEPTPSVPPSAPPTRAAAPANDTPERVHRGRLAEVIQVAQYTYLRFESGEWAAVNSAPSLAVGQEVGVLMQSEMTDFFSPSLSRTFPKIWLGALEGAAPKDPATENRAAPGPKGPAPEVKAALRAVDSSAALTLRVVDLYAERQLLAGRRVKVKGTVDRVNLVQGVHYVHLRDGSGSPSDKTNDLVCLSAVEVQKDQAVTMEGLVAVDKDLGMGIIPVVLEQAQAR